MPIITFVRHGTTENMERSILNGATDSPLSARGREEARRVAEALRGRSFDAFYASPTGRAMETARAITAVIGMEPEPVDALREIDFGWMENSWLPVPNRPQLQGLRDLMWAVYFSIGGLTGESLPQMERRVAAALPGLLDHGGYRRVLVVSHTMVHRAIAAHFGGSRLSTRERSNYIEPCAYSEFELDERGAPVAVRLNQMEHLKGLNGG